VTPITTFSLRGFTRFWKPIAVTAVILGLLLASSTWLHLEIPTLTGEYSVGRQEFLWTDPMRPEAGTQDLGDHRQVGLVVWYPAESGTGSPAPYVPDLDAIESGLLASGEFNSLKVAGLRWVRSHSFADAAINPAADRYPLLVLSPGNATNVEFYGSLAEDLASNGYVVVGLNHPFQVTAMSLTDGSLAVYDVAAGADPVADKIAERVADVEFVLNKLGRETAAGRLLDGRIDLSRVGVLGHSRGGLTAAEVCRTSTGVTACMNIDGQATSGPFGTSSEPAPVGRPFMYLTKEVEIHPALAATFEQSGVGTFRVVVPAATHEQFADGPLFQPGLWPLDRTADQVQTVTRGFARAFFDEFLAGRSSGQWQPLPIIDAPTDVYLYGYPLGINQPQ
jgi:alpha-beta hydrolase superfamily lysophospholipase